MTPSPSDIELLRAEIAAAAARMIAEDGADYGTAKRKAARQILGETRVRGDILPDNAQVEDEVRLYNELFLADTQPARLLRLREIALAVMTELEAFNPFLTGAVLNGTAGEHSDIHLQLFTHSPKDVEVFLLNRNIGFEVSETPHFHRRGEPVETASFMRDGEAVHLALFAYDDLRARKGADRRNERADITALRKIMTGIDTE
ncbi:MAG: hypothetical protein ACO1N5_12525 [Noviherbaspirillum sp.]